jgi:hypothetical protein
MFFGSCLVGVVIPQSVEGGESWSLAALLDRLDV